jgi:hypothetical protein
MEKIDRGYAVIYIDRTGESLVVENENYKMDYTTKDMVSDYYNESGFRQWNFYLIIPKSLVREEDIENIENCDKYTRKYVVDDEDIDIFIEEKFPIMDNENKGSILLIKGKSWVDTLEKAYDKQDDYTLYKSWYREDSLMDSLEKMDELRASLIKRPNLKAMFCTHISNEMGIAEKKFKLFLEDENT